MSISLYRSAINLAQDPGDGTIEENAKKQNGQNVGFGEIKDVTVRIMLRNI